MSKGISMRELSKAEQQNVTGGYSFKGGRLQRRFDEPMPRSENTEESWGLPLPSSQPNVQPNVAPPADGTAVPSPTPGNGPAWTYDRLPTQSPLSHNEASSALPGWDVGLPELSGGVGGD
jgi:hypothetical protein